MADKYLIVGAAFYGDGTSSAEATVAGGVGAWNSLNVLYGTVPTYGTLVSGDTLNVRSKTAAGADLYYGSGGAYTVGPASGLTGVIVSLDGGTIWPGIAGTCTFDVTGTQETISFRTGNSYIAYAQGAFKVRSTRTNYVYPIAIYGIQAKNLEFSFPNKTDTGAISNSVISIGGSVLDNCIFACAAGPFAIANSSPGSKAILINPTINLTSTAGLTVANGIFSSAVGSSVEIYGGTVSGVGAISSQALFYAGAAAGATSDYLAIGFCAPNEMPLVSTGAEGSPQFNVRLLSADKKASASIGGGWGYADSRSDGYYPQLSATLPDTASTGWSWKFKSSYANIYRPAKLMLSKMYTGTAAAKTITLELLVSNSISASVNKSSVSMLVQYINNTTGNSVTEKSSPTGTLDVSTANWSTITYGAASFDKRKLSLTTSGNIKQDTLVNIVLFVTYAASGANDLYFIDPDPSLT